MRNQQPFALIGFIHRNPICARGPACLTRFCVSCAPVQRIYTSAECLGVFLIHFNKSCLSQPLVAVRGTFLWICLQHSAAVVAV